MEESFRKSCKSCMYDIHYSMKRKQVYITERQDKKLKKASGDTGLSEAEIIRRALDYYFNTKNITL